MTLTSLLASAALSLFALQSNIDTLVANALEISSPAGTYTTYFEADGTYTTNVGISGTWEAQDGELCVSRATGEHNCQPLMDHLHVGDSWEGQNAAGDTVTVTVVAR